MNRLSSIFLCLTAAATAQQPTFPMGLGSPIGTTQQVLGKTYPERIQTIYHPSVLPDGNFMVHAVELRSGFQTAPAMTANITLRVSSIGVPMPEQADQASFAANHGIDLQTTVLPGVQFPAMQWGGPRPTVELQLAAPFVRPDGAALLVELDVTVQSVVGGGQSKWTIEVQEYPAEFWYPNQHVLGTGCANGLMVNKVVRVFPPQETVVWRFFTNYTAGTPAVLMLGLSDQYAGNVPLPMDLGVIGAPGCPLEVAVDATRLVSATPVGFSPQLTSMFTSDTVLPRTPALAGTKVSGQFLIFDPPHNPAGIATTPHARYDLMTPPKAERVRYSHSWVPPGIPHDVIQNWIPYRGLVFNARLR